MTNNLSIDSNSFIFSDYQNERQAVSAYQEREKYYKYILQIFFLEQEKVRLLEENNLTTNHLITKLKILNFSLKNNHNHKEKLDVEVKKLEEQSAKQDEKIKTSKKQLQEIEQNISRIKERNAIIETDQDEQKKILDEIHNDYSECRKKIEQWGSFNQQLHQGIKETKTEFNQLKLDYKNLAKDFIKLGSENKLFFKTIGENNKRILDDFGQHLLDFKELNKKSKRQIKQLDELVKVRSQMGKDLDDLVEKTNQLILIRSQIRKDLEDLAENSDPLTSDKSQIRKDLEDLVEISVQLRSNIKKLEKDRNQITEDLDKIERNVNELENLSQKDITKNLSEQKIEEFSIPHKASELEKSNQEISKRTDIQDLPLINKSESVMKTKTYAAASIALIIFGMMTKGFFLPPCP